MKVSITAAILLASTPSIFAWSLPWSSPSSLEKRADIGLGPLTIHIEDTCGDSLTALAVILINKLQFLVYRSYVFYSSNTLMEFFLVTSSRVSKKVVIELSLSKEDLKEILIQSMNTAVRYVELI